MYLWDDKCFMASLSDLWHGNVWAAGQPHHFKDLGHTPASSNLKFGELVGKTGDISLFYLFCVCCVSNCIRSWETLGRQCEKAHMKVWSLSNNPIVPQQPRIFEAREEQEPFQIISSLSSHFSPLDRLACADPIQKERGVCFLLVQTVNGGASKEVKMAFLSWARQPMEKGSLYQHQAEICRWGILLETLPLFSSQIL